MYLRTDGFTLNDLRALVLGALVLVGCAHGAAHTQRDYAGPVIDTHVHLQEEPLEGHDATLPAISSALDEGRVSRAGLVVIAQRGKLEQTRAQNDRVAAAVHARPERYFGYGSVHPEDGEDALVEVDRIAAIGLRGLKLHPNTQKLDVAAPSVDRVVERAAKAKLVVLFDGYSPFDADETGKFAMLALRHPDARIVLAHMGGPRFLDMMLFSFLALYPSMYKRNVWVDLSAASWIVAGSPSLTEQLRHVCRRIGMDRVLFGSDFPLFTPAQALADTRALGFTADEQKQVLHDNAAALFGLDTR